MAEGNERVICDLLEQIDEKVNDSSYEDTPYAVTSSVEFTQGLLATEEASRPGHHYADPPRVLMRWLEALANPTCCSLNFWARVLTKWLGEGDGEPSLTALRGVSRSLL